MKCLRSKKKINSLIISTDRGKEIADEVISIASSAASMERKALENRVIHLETQLLLAKKTNRNKNLHDKILKDTANTVSTLKTYDLNQLCWVESWVTECKKKLENADINGDQAEASAYVQGLGL
jgi:hypothetical protein